MDGAALSPELTAKEKAEKLQSLATGPLSASLARVSASSRALPSDKDFHFFNSFSEFKNPVRDIAGKSEFLLNSVGASAHLVFGGKPLPHFPAGADPEDSADWLVGVNDEIFERVDASLDEFRDSRNKEEEAGVKAAVAMEEDGFQLVYGKKKKPGVNVKSGVGNGGGGGSVVRVASRDPKTEGPRAKVPFHIATIPRPQDEYGILVNNSNLPFEHVWLQKSEDGCRFIHPLEKLSLEDFIDRRASDIDSVRPPLIENTPFKLVEEVKELKELAKKLQDAEEFSVDLEHNHYRSFQGLTCLMQISTRTEDFVVDTLKLRVHVGPYLREVFKDPSKRKVMHGADRDIVWLQRDFGIYVCNMFDTGQASRLLALERNSLEYLLQHFCGVTANKEYQNADWRFRPLSDDMIKYARADTHYLLYIYDLMRARLLSLSQTGDDLLLEVYNRSSAICTKLYEKELLTDTSFLYIYGLNGVDFNAQQLAVVAGLCAWRDSVARAEDESTGYILPNKALLEIARQMPNTAGKLKRLVKSKHPFVERNLNVVVSIIRSSIANAAAFEDVAEQLKKEREEVVPEEGQVATSDPISMDICPQLERIQQNTGSVKPFEQFNSAQSSSALPKTSSSIHPGQNGAYSESDTCPSIKPAAVVSVQALKKPSRAFGAMLGSSSSKRKHEHDKTASKLEQIKSSVTLPFHSFSGVPETSRTVSVVSNTASDRASMSREAVGPASDQVFSVEGDIPLQSDKNTVFLESIDPQFGESVVAEAARDSDFIPLEVDLVDQTGKLADGSITEDTMKQKGNSDGNDDLELEPSPAYENPLAELSSSLQEYCRTVIRTEERSSEGGNDIGEPLDKLQKQMKLTEDDSKTNNGDKLSSTSLESNRVDKVFSLPRMPGEGSRDSSLEPRRSQAFPASGNRSMTFTQ